MSIPMNHLFETRDLQPEGSGSWNREIFERAYCGGNGPFDRVCQRLERGFSVLVSLPGNCMTAAAEFVTGGRVGGDGRNWSELGKPSDKEETIADVWRHSFSMFEMITAWFRGGRGAPPKVIFHNLDFLSDGRGGIDLSNEAKTALLYLTDSTRAGVVLGLSDRDAGELPAPIRRAFAEQRQLNEIPVDRFPKLIPVRLGELLKEDGGIPDGAAWLIASRLRWTDPIRAVKIMDDIAKQMKDGNLNKILGEILRATKTVEFLSPEDIEDVEIDHGTGRPTGFEPDTISLLQNNFIAPFRRWAHFTGSKEACQFEIRRLPPGLILHGPPGTGKTRLARWVAKSISLPVRQVSAADLRRADFGLTEKLVQDLFRSARRAAPCVIILDDADDLLPNRDKVQGSVASAEIGTVNAFLQELSGFYGPLEGVLVILTTNRFHEIDQAAKDRLPIHPRIPYPLDSDQVSQIIATVARSYNFVLTEEVRNRLLERFMGPVIPTTQPLKTPEERRKLDKNLFSPRAIESAMRLLVGDNGNRPGLEDVDRMESYLKRRQQDGTE